MRRPGEGALWAALEVRGELGECGRGAQQGPLQGAAVSLHNERVTDGASSPPPTQPSAARSFEAELQSLRLRLSAEHQMQLERADAGGWGGLCVDGRAGCTGSSTSTCKRTHSLGPQSSAPLPARPAPAAAARREDAARLAAAAAEYEQRLAAARAEWEAEKAGLAAAARREAERVRQEFESGQVRWHGAPAGLLHRKGVAGIACGVPWGQQAAAATPVHAPQEAWRAAASARARREMEGREAALRRALAAQQEEELRLVVARLEGEALEREAEAQVGGAGARR